MYKTNIWKIVPTVKALNAVQKKDKEHKVMQKINANSNKSMKNKYWRIRQEHTGPTERERKFNNTSITNFIELKKYCKSNQNAFDEEMKQSDMDKKVQR